MDVLGKGTNGKVFSYIVIDPTRQALGDERGEGGIRRSVVRIGVEQVLDALGMDGRYEAVLYSRNLNLWTVSIVDTESWTGVNHAHMEKGSVGEHPLVKGLVEGNAVLIRSPELGKLLHREASGVSEREYCPWFPQTPIGELNDRVFRAMEEFLESGGEGGVIEASVERMSYLVSSLGSEGEFVTALSRAFLGEDDDPERIRYMYSVPFPYFSPGRDEYERLRDRLHKEGLAESLVRWLSAEARSIGEPLLEAVRWGKPRTGRSERGKRPKTGCQGGDRLIMRVELGEKLVYLSFGFGEKGWEENVDLVMVFFVLPTDISRFVALFGLPVFFVRSLYGAFSHLSIPLHLPPQENPSQTREGTRITLFRRGLPENGYLEDLATGDAGGLRILDEIEVFSMSENERGEYVNTNWGNLLVALELGNGVNLSVHKGSARCGVGGLKRRIPISQALDMGPEGVISSLVETVLDFVGRSGLLGKEMDEAFLEWVRGDGSPEGETPRGPYGFPPGETQELLFDTLSLARHALVQCLSVPGTGTVTVGAPEPLGQRVLGSLVLHLLGRQVNRLKGDAPGAPGLSTSAEESDRGAGNYLSEGVSEQIRSRGWESIQDHLYKDGLRIAVFNTKTTLFAKSSPPPSAGHQLVGSTLWEARVQAYCPTYVDDWKFIVIGP